MIEIKEEKINNQVVIHLGGRIDSTSAIEFEEKLIEIIDTKCYTIVIDFINVQFISSAGLRVLLLAAKKVKPYNGQILLSSLSADVREVFDISGFSSIFGIHEDISSAISSL